MEKKPPEPSGDNVKSRCDQWSSPVRGAGTGKVCSLLQLIFTPLWLSSSDGPCSATESPSFPHSCGGREDAAAGTGAPRTVLTPSCQGTAKVLLAWAGTPRNPQALGWNFLQASQWCLQERMLSGWWLRSLPSQATICLHSASGSWPLEIPTLK